MVVVLVMAKPIEPTPVLRGEDAVALLEDIRTLRYSDKKAERIKRAIETYEKYSKKR